MLASLILALGLYPRSMTITTIDTATDTVICEDLAGLEWEFNGAEDLCEGDIIACLMYNNGTPDNIYDDIIMEVR